MIVGALLLALIGSADLVRCQAALARRWATLLVAFIWVGILALAVTGLGTSPWWAVAAAAGSTAWIVLTSTRPGVPSKGGIAPAIALLVAELAAIAAHDLFEPAQGYVVAWHAGSVVSALPLAAVVMAIGCVLFLVESANIVVRAALRPTEFETAQREDDISSGASSRRRTHWWIRDTVTTPPSTVVPDLRGGRLIGPLERLLILALTLVGAPAIVAGLLAAKGIVRFPEISNDASRGSKAEYFLVGSLVSWALALGATGLIWISAQG